MWSEKLLGNHPKGSLFVISAPAGTGKTTLVKMLLAEFPVALHKSCSLTTRGQRPGEIVSQEYEYVSAEKFELLLEQKAFLEHAKVFGHYYGTPRAWVQEVRGQGKHVILVIDTQGALQIKKQEKEAVLIFISPPSLETLKTRLFKRATEDHATIERRFEQAKKEMSMIPHYDYHFVNDDLDLAYQILRSIFIAEEHRR